MKKLNSIISLIIGIWLLGTMSCHKKDDNKPNPTDPQAEVKANLTSGTWNLLSVTRDNIDVGSEFSGFTIKFTNTGYTVQNGGTALSSSGSWAFNGSSTTQIIFDGALTVTLAFSNNDTNLQLRFSIPTTEYNLGRVETLQGNYVFNLAK